jgi:DNA-directed RNA polymerase specialized sigma24 family protein
MRTQDDVDNVVQRTLLLAFVHRDQFRDPAKFKSWLCSIAVNEIRMILRSTKGCVSLNVCPEVGAAETIDSPFTRLQERERLAHLGSEMTRLRERDQAAILDGLSVAQAATATATSIAAAKSARFRARQCLARAMRNQCLVRAVGNSR